MLWRKYSENGNFNVDGFHKLPFMNYITNRNIDDEWRNKLPKKNRHLSRADKETLVAVGAALFFFGLASGDMAVPTCADYQTPELDNCKY